MASRELYLLTESRFTYCYLVQRWITHFRERSEFKGIILAEEPPSARLVEQRRQFHREFAGRRSLSREMDDVLSDLYPGYDDTERALIQTCGVPECATTQHPETIYFEGGVHGDNARKWLEQTCQRGHTFYVFIGVSQVLPPWWMEYGESRVINTHSAVLPYARGIYSIENIAADRDIEEFRRAVGATVHYVDAGIDTGPVIRSTRVLDPFRFGSIWELKGYLYLAGFDLQLEVADDMAKREESIPVGVVSDPALRGVNYRKRDFTPDRRKQAQAGYLAMKLVSQEVEYV